MNIKGKIKTSENLPTLLIKYNYRLK